MLKERYGVVRRIDDLPFGPISNLEESVSKNMTKRRSSPATDEGRVGYSSVYWLRAELVEWCFQGVVA